MPINFTKAAQINRVADEALKNILSKRDDTPDMYAEINKIDDLEVAKIVIRRLMEKINEKGIAVPGSCERDNMALLHLTFTSRNEFIDWLRAKLTEAHSTVEFMEWLSDFFDQGNTVTVCGREYTFMDCYDMI